MTIVEEKIKKLKEKYNANSTVNLIMLMDKQINDDDKLIDTLITNYIEHSVSCATNGGHGDCSCGLDNLIS